MSNVTHISGSQFVPGAQQSFSYSQTQIKAPPDFGDASVYEFSDQLYLVSFPENVHVFISLRDEDYSVWIMNEFGAITSSADKSATHRIRPVMNPDGVKRNHVSIYLNDGTRLTYVSGKELRISLWNQRELVAYPQGVVKCYENGRCRYSVTAIPIPSIELDDRGDGKWPSHESE